MKRKLNIILSYILVALMAAGVTLISTLLATRDDSKLRELEAILDRYYIGQVDDDAMEEAMAEAMVKSLDDRWSYYMTAEEYLAYQDTMANSYVGVGVTVRSDPEGQGIVIMDVIAGGPAEEAGLLDGDRIVAIGGQSVLQMNVDQIDPLIRGEEGTTVELTVDRAGDTLSFIVTRRRFQTPVATLEMLDDGMALITIENFDSRCAQETIAAIDSAKAQGAKALIFDVRNNPGGYKDEMVKVLDHLLPEGDLFRTVDYLGNESVDRSDADCVDLPMAVVMNLSSYSAAEFFAAALDEYDAAITVGQQTYGKGRFQTTFALSDGSAVTLSIGEYFTPKGKNLAGIGLMPDVEATVDEEMALKIAYDLLDPSEDPQIQAAINALKQGN